MIPSPLHRGHGVLSRFGASSKRADFSTMLASQNCTRSSVFSFAHHSSRVGGFGISICGAGCWLLPLFCGGGALLPPVGGLIFGGSIRNEPAPYFAYFQEFAFLGRASKKVFVSAAVTAGSFAWKRAVSSSNTLSVAWLRDHVWMSLKGTSFGATFCWIRCFRISTNFFPASSAKYAVRFC